MVSLPSRDSMPHRASGDVVHAAGVGAVPCLAQVTELCVQKPGDLWGGGTTVQWTVLQI